MARGPGRLPRIALVTAHPHVRHGIAIGLRGGGVRHLKKTLAAKYDLIIVDVMMETMTTGFEVVRR